jgi:hypothetical protein
MAFLKKPFPNGSKAALNNLKRALLMMLNRIAVLASHLDALMRPAIAAIQQGVRGGELRHRRNEHFDGLPVDLNPDHPPHKGDELVDGLSATVPREHAGVMLQLVLLDRLRLDRPATRVPALALREWSPTRTAYDARLAHNSCSFPLSEMIIPLMV